VSPAYHKPPRTRHRVLERHDRIAVPDHLIPRVCSMCKREIVNVPNSSGTLRIEYRTIRFDVRDSKLYGTEHACPAALREPSR